ncbi:DNA translocase FtsK [Marinicrinis lubricantis]|uniref:DNA translocase FtsK n=1 Tax=Marinicrinis lubricantis TaxID=2086470 RepID=A0ABW1IMU8_9BACL
MAKRRKRKKNLGMSLKYEVYGILIIVFSIISLAGKEDVPGIGSVGRSLSYISLFLAGQLYFAIPLICIYIGLYVMIKRDWPVKWTFKKTGVLLFILALLILFHIELFTDKYPAGNQTFGTIVGQPWLNLQEQLANPNYSQTFLQEIGGGQIGAILYALLFLLLDNLGARLIVWTLFAISFICMTGWSLSDIVKKLRKGSGGFMKQLKLRLSESRAAVRQRKRTPEPAVSDDFDLYDDELLDEEAWTPELSSSKPKKRKLFFQLFQNEKKAESQSLDDDFEPAEDVLSPVQDEEQVVYSADENGEMLSNDAKAKYNDDLDVPSHEEPLFRDFQEHVLVSKLPAVQDDLEIKSEQHDMPVQEASEHIQNAGSEEEQQHDEGVDAVSLEAPVERKIPYQLPPLDLLSMPLDGGAGGSSSDYRANARKLEATLESFGVRARVLEVVRGPAVTRYEIQPDIGVKVSRIVSLTDDIALALAAKDIRMEAPIPGKSAIGIEVPNSEVSIVTMREVMESATFQKSEAKLSIALGRDISGQPIVANLAKMPHLLVAGATGSGKSVCINGIITSVIYKAKPEEVKFLMIDPKMVELNVYNGIPHLLSPVVTDPRRASLALKKIVKEMENRYELFSKSGTRNIEGYNKLLVQDGQQPLPLIVVIVDELADLMMVAANDVEDAICRLAQMARAAGIHLIIATQRPSVDVITGVIKANIPSRIAFGVSSQVDSRTILDSVGAEKLLGRGDMLFLPVGSSKPVRVQGAFLSDQEVEAVVSFVSKQEEAQYQEDLVPEIDDTQETKDEFEDELFDQAVGIVLEAKQASVSLLQRRMRIGYTRAARLIDSMEAKGIVGPYEGSKPREVLTSLEMYQQQNRISS